MIENNGVRNTKFIFQFIGSFNEFLLKNQSAFDIHSIRVYKFLHGILRETFTVTKQKKAKPKGCLFFARTKIVKKTRDSFDGQRFKDNPNSDILI